MKRTALTGLLVVAILVGAGVGYLIGNANERNVTSTLIIVSTDTVTTALPPSPSFVNGLQLVVSVEPSTFTVGQNVTILAWVYNPTPTTLTVASPGLENPYQWSCQRYSPTAVNVYSGYWGFNNSDTGAPPSSATPLLQWQPIPQSCHPTPSIAYTFLPYGANSTEERVMLGGYYVPPTGGPGNHFQQFPTGQYTVVVWDAWGQQVVEYFEAT